VEAPSYPGAIRTLQGSGARLVSVPLDDQGMRTDALEQTLERLEAGGVRPKCIYTIPTFHNPAGVTLPLERRRRLVEIAARHRVLIVEDDAYHEIRFTDTPVPSVFAVAGGQGVLRCGTVSKTIAPGLRVGWVKGPTPLIDALVRMRFDNGTSPLTQRTVVAYVESGAFEPHVVEMRAIYKRKFEAMDAALGEYCSRYCTWNVPQGGFYIWIKIPGGVDCLDLLKLGWEEGVNFFAGNSYFPEGGGHDYIRLAYSAVSEEQIVQGCAALGRALTRAVR
jgi:2-aminoadipate transaminase